MSKYISFLTILLVTCGTTTEDIARPEDTVLAMFEAAQSGNVQEYLDYFSGDIRTTLDRNAEDMTEQAFTEYLIKANEPIVGIAVSDVTPIDVNSVTIRVELVFRNKNEIQTYTLFDEQGDWKIVNMTRSKRIKTLVPYGQKVFELPAEPDSSQTGQNPDNLQSP
jgi:hypothetical protein